MLQATPKDIYELIVVDDSNDNLTSDYLSSIGITTIKTPGNIGVAKARNMAIKAALDISGVNCICFLHNDMLFPAHWLEDSLDVLSALEPFSVLGIANILDPDCLDLSQDMIDKISIDCRENKIAFANLEPRFYPVKLFREVGLLDESFAQSEAEDVDFNIRIKQSGYNITATNLVNVFHLLGYTRLKLFDNVRIRQTNLQAAIKKFGKEKFDDFNRAERKIKFSDGMPYTLYGC